MTVFRWATLVWAIATLLLLGLPSSAVPIRGFAHADKLVHTLIFCSGSFVALRGWPHRRFSAAGLVLLFALLAELWQLILPTHRHADPSDTLANAVGVILGASLALLTNRR
jgi:hypothetical protein